MCVTCVQCIQTQLVRLDAQAISWWGRRYIAAHFWMRPRKIPVSVWSCRVALRSIATIYFRTIYFIPASTPLPFLIFRSNQMHPFPMKNSHVQRSVLAQLWLFDPNNPHSAVCSRSLPLLTTRVEANAGSKLIKPPLYLGPALKHGPDWANEPFYCQSIEG